MQADDTTRMAPPKRKGFHLSQIRGNNHGRRARHGEGAAERHSVFAKWVCATLLGDAPARGRVVDVGGGKGHLSASLAALGVPCTLVDPCAMVGRAGMMADGTSRDGGLADAPAAPLSSLITVQKATLEAALLREPRLISDAAAVVGMHPDEATECIVDCALLHGVPFAVVPCCATPNLFPNRRCATGCRVKKYGGLVEYLLEKVRDLNYRSISCDSVSLLFDWLPPSHPPGWSRPRLLETGSEDALRGPLFRGPQRGGLYDVIRLRSRPRRGARVAAP